MPRISERQKLLDALAQAWEELGVQIFVQILLDAVNAESPPASTGSSSSSDTPDSGSHSETTHSGSNHDSITRGSSGSSDSSDIPTQVILAGFYDAITALEDEVRKARVLQACSRSTQIPQLQLLDEWGLNNPRLFRRKLRVTFPVFVKIVEHIQDHPIFHNNSNRPQLPVQIQLAIFLNAAGHYGNAATLQDMAEWAGVFVGTVHNCYKRVMIAIQSHHDSMIHFDLTQQKDREEKQRAQEYVEERTCSQWKGGFLCVDGTPFKLFQKPGWHGEGFFDRKSNYSLSNQVSDLSHRMASLLISGSKVVVFPHNLRIVDYVIGVPGSLHDSTAFQNTRIACFPHQFFQQNEWLWADSAYGCQPWCMVPFKRPTEGTLTRSQKTFNYYLSKVCIFVYDNFITKLVFRYEFIQNTSLHLSKVDFNHSVICGFKFRMMMISNMPIPGYGVVLSFTI
jgi:hypothetical protein